jgi:hypothetical protein
MVQEAAESIGEKVSDLLDVLKIRCDEYFKAGPFF